MSKEGEYFMLKKLVMLAALSILAGCMSHNAQVYSQIDSANKTITVPPGASGLKGKLKQVLANDGWKMVVFRGASVTEGEVGTKTKLEQYDTFNSRYQLVVTSEQLDRCINGLTPYIIYDVSVIDTKSGAEVLTVNGRGCEPSAVKEFIKALHGKTAY